MPNGDSNIVMIHCEVYVIINIKTVPKELVKDLQAYHSKEISNGKRDSVKSDHFSWIGEMGKKYLMSMTPAKINKKRTQYDENFDEVLFPPKGCQS